MKTLRLLLLSVALAVTVRADLFTGTITETITNTTDPRFSPNQVLTGWFSYESDQMDGTYGSGTLTGAVQAIYFGSSMFDRPFTSCFAGLSLTVLDGAVTSFFASDQMGFLSFTFADGGFAFKGNLANDWGAFNEFWTSGTLTYSAPQATVTPLSGFASTGVQNVPDAGATAALLGVGILALGAIRRLTLA